MKVFPIGYSAPEAKKSIDNLLKNEKTLLIDTRYIPYSWNPEWRKEELSDRYAGKYHWAGQYLGNKAKDTGGIEIVDPDTGISGLIGYLSRGHDLILMCQCKELAQPEPAFEKCHVSKIIKLLGEKIPEVEVVKLEQPKRSTLEEDAKELVEVFEPEGRMIICQRTGRGKGCTMTWVVGDKVSCSIPWCGDVHGIVRSTRMEGLSQKVQLRIAVYNALAQNYIISDDKRWFDGENLKPRSTIIAELGEHEE